MVKRPDEIGGIKRLPPRRTINKKQATRHLIHCAVRSIASGEDPFAIHLMVQSADKLLFDSARHLGKPLAHSWTDLVKPEFQRPFINVIRETYNYFKHADKDYEEELHVGDIAESNILQLAMSVVNYQALYGEWTSHMRLLLVAAKVILPSGFVGAEERESFDALIGRIGGMTFGQFFNQQIWADPLLSAHFPNLLKERAEDLHDNELLYSTKIISMPVKR